MNPVTRPEIEIRREKVFLPSDISVNEVKEKYDI